KGGGAAPAPPGHFRNAEAADAWSGASGRRKLGAQFVEDLLRRRARNLLDVVLVFQDRAERVGDDLGRKRDDVEREEAFRPVDRLGHARLLEEVLAPELLDEGDDLAAEGFRGLRRAGAQDLHLALE